LIDRRIKSASDLAMLPGARVLGSLPDSVDDPTKIAAPELVVRRQPSSVLAESYRQVAGALLPQLDQTESQTLLLMSGLPEAGTTTVASNLAAAAAATGRNVLLIDANFRRPALGKIMEISDTAPGLGDVLANAASLEEAIHDAGDGVSVMPAGSPGNRVFERLNNGLIDGVLADLRTRFDLIIFDAPPAVVAGDAMMLANKVDAAVLVIRANQEHRGLVSRMITRLSEARCHLIGVLLNRPRGIAGGYLKKNYAAMAEYSRSGASS
jgi:capsular exopolysaccharide synthesis family protein